jgi:isochorismate pyruvate lyase
MFIAYQGKEFMKAPSECRNLTDIRTAVNSIDRELIKLLGRRARYALAALTFKHDRKDIADPAHRRKMFAQRRQWAKRPHLNPRMIDRIFQAIVDESKRLHLAGLRTRQR